MRQKLLWQRFRQPLKIFKINIARATILAQTSLSMITLELDQQANGQWRYRILQTLDGSQSVKVDWEWGPFSEEEAIQQAKDRFGRCNKILILDWI